MPNKTSGKRVITQFITGSLTAFLLASASAAHADCQFGRIAELPVTMTGLRPLISIKVNDQDARFLLDSGAFWSMMSAASADHFGLRQAAAPFGLFMRGAGGTASVNVARVKTLTFAEYPFSNVDFLVGGTDLEGAASGLIGQNLLRIADVEYDLANGAIRLWRPKSCEKNNLAYWAKDAPLSIVDLLPTTPMNPHNITTVVLNGVKLRAVLDTGASTSVLSRSAARRAGLTPDSPGVTAAGSSSGIGRHMVSTWIGQFDSFEIGDIKVLRPKLRFADDDLGDSDMLLGDDFFLSTRILVATSQHKLYFTYNGGRMFNLAMQSGDAAAAAADHKGPILPPAPEPTDAGGFARRGSALLARGDVDGALIDLDKACTLAPKNAGYLYARALAHARKGQPLLEGADLDAAVMLEPANAEIRLARAVLRLRAHDPAGAREDADAASAAVPQESNMHLDIAALYIRLDRFPDAVAQFGLWIPSHKDDARMTMALNGRCWARALGNLDLDQALADCNKAASLSPKITAIKDSRATVRLRRGEFAQAIADYGVALADRPNLATALYGRGIANIRLGHEVEGKADIAAATRIDAELPARWKRYGIVP